MNDQIDWELVDVLKRIENGQTHFQPTASTREATNEFQPLACAVIEAERLGLLSKVFPHKESVQGTLAYDSITVAGGLTHSGRRYLKKAVGQSTPADHLLNSSFTHLPDQHLHLQWDKALARRRVDPSGAVTASRSFLESTQKWILAQRGKAVSDTRRLFSATLQEVGLASQATPMSEVLRDIDKLLISIGKVRHAHGDAHGVGDSSANLSTAEATLCVNLAGALGLFLLECHEDQKD
ncbi:hypothetical protein AO390_04025 [Pseudomonas marginalis ICMP 11289]|nr:hypothetical protein AO390_04025 [Pseudomonas marginalis ICMP 11289]